VFTIFDLNLVLLVLLDVSVDGVLFLLELLMSCAQGSYRVIELLIVERAIVQRSTSGSTGGWLDLGALLLVDIVFLVGVVGVEAQALYREITIKVRHYRRGRIEVLDTLQVLEILLQVGDVVFLLLLPHSLEDAFDVEAITELFLRAFSEKVEVLILDLPIFADLYQKVDRFRELHLVLLQFLDVSQDLLDHDLLGLNVLFTLLLDVLIRLVLQVLLKPPLGEGKIVNIVDQIVLDSELYGLYSVLKGYVVGA
jgi:hypothetical protein